MASKEHAIIKELAQDFESVLTYWSNLLSVAVERNRLLILVALLDSELSKERNPQFLSTNTRSLTFGQLKTKAGLQKNPLDYHLSILQKMGLIDKRDRKPFKITKEGKKVLDAIGITEELMLTFQQRVKAT